jgi:integrase
VESYIRGLPVANRTKNINLTILRMVFQKAVDWGYLAASPASGIKRWRQECLGSRSLNQKEIGRLLDLATPWENSVIKVMVYTGMRPGELSQLKFQDIDWEKKLLYIVSDKTRKTKNRKTRLVPLFSDLEQELTMLQKYRPNMIYRNGERESLKYFPRTTAQQEYVFCHPNGKPIQSFRRCIRSALTRAEIQGVSPYGLRKSFCSLLARQGVHPKVAQRLLGHSDIRLTMDIYTHIDDDQLRTAIDSLPSCRDLQTQSSLQVGN